MTGDELAALRTLIREEITASEQRTRTLMREEVNAAVYASEQRMRMFVGDEIKASEQRMHVFVREEITAAVYTSEQRMHVFIREEIGASEQHLRIEITASEQRLGKRLDGIEARLHRVEVLQTQMATNLAQMGSVLEEATIKINELQMNFIALDQKVEGIKRDIQKLMYRVDTAEEAVSGLSSRLKMHRDTPINEAHPPTAA